MSETSLDVGLQPKIWTPRQWKHLQVEAVEVVQGVFVLLLEVLEANATPQLNSGDAVEQIHLTERRLLTPGGHENTKCVFTSQRRNRQELRSEPGSCFINLLKTKTDSSDRAVLRPLTSHTQKTQLSRGFLHEVQF